MVTTDAVVRHADVNRNQSRDLERHAPIRNGAHVLNSHGLFLDHLFSSERKLGLLLLPLLHECLDFILCFIHSTVQVCKLGVTVLSIPSQSLQGILSLLLCSFF